MSEERLLTDAELEAIERRCAEAMARDVLSACRDTWGACAALRCRELGRTAVHYRPQPHRFVCAYGSD